jgi:hypothetical protein
LRETARGRLEVRLAHVHAHQLIIGDAEHHAAIGRADANITLVGQPFQADKAGKTARAVAALVNFAAVRVKNTVVEIEVGIVRRLNHQQLIEPHAQMPIRQATDQFREKNTFCVTASTTIKSLPRPCILENCIICSIARVQNVVVRD